MSDHVVGFTPADAERIGACVKHYERSYRFPDAPPSNGIRTPLRIAYVAYTPSGGVPAATGTPGGTITPGSATVTLYLFQNGVLTLTSKTLTVYNMTTSAVGGSKLVQIKYIDCCWWVDVESC